VGPQSPSRKTALVTGASYGVGAACALALARDGFDVAVSATRLENLDATMAALAAAPCRMLPLALELRSGTSISGVVKKIMESFGRLDVLINNAGVDLRKPALDVTATELRELVEVNVIGTFLITQEVARTMIARGQGGAIVNIASSLGLVGAAERAAYGISKAAMRWRLAGSRRLRPRAPPPPRIPITCRRCSIASRSVASRPSRRSLQPPPILPARRRKASPARCSPSTAGSPRLELLPRSVCGPSCDQCRCAPCCRAWLSGAA
jgi:NADP-dependent 3-hydroxy acid dehydrogenase YdfG